MDTRLARATRTPMIVEKGFASAPIGPAESLACFRYSLANVPTIDFAVAAFLAQVPDMRALAESSAVVAWLSSFRWPLTHAGKSALFKSLPMALIPSLSAFLPENPDTLTLAEFLQAISEVILIFSALFGQSCEVVLSLLAAVQEDLFLAWRDDLLLAAPLGDMSLAVNRVAVGRILTVRFLRVYNAWHASAKRALLVSFHASASSVRSAGSDSLPNEATGAIAVDPTTRIPSLISMLRETPFSFSDVLSLASSTSLAAGLSASTPAPVGGTPSSHRAKKSSVTAAAESAIRLTTISSDSRAKKLVLLETGTPVPAWLLSALTDSSSSDLDWCAANRAVYNLRASDVNLCFSFLRGKTCARGAECKYAHVSMAGKGALATFVVTPSVVPARA